MNMRIAMFAVVWAMLCTSVQAKTNTVTLSVDNMTCATCPLVVRAALYDLEGVEKVYISMADKQAVVTFDDEKLKIDQLTDATTNAGFPSVVADSG
jgi:mercuric ion binding protein